jgi:RimJ/RimL family protein N-acetyltransferase
MNPRSRTPRIRTERLLMREWRNDDLAPFAVLNADPRVTEHFASSLTPPESDDLVERIRTCWRERGYGLWALERTDTGEFIGYTGLWPAEFDAPFTPAVEVGWRLAPEHWGHGFATEAGHEAVRYGFETVGLPEIVSFTATGNARSRRVMERLGLQRDPDGDFAHPAMPPGHAARSHVLYRLRAEDRDDRAVSRGPRTRCR